ncbi:MAG: hypothetical protein VXW22_11725, partial [Pseudomonadota bacterium]|nr:hypothetical protein [Pseudomonadota bacterium]
SRPMPDRPTKLLDSAQPRGPDHKLKFGRGVGEIEYPSKEEFLATAKATRSAAKETLHPSRFKRFGEPRETEPKTVADLVPEWQRTTPETD